MRGGNFFYLLTLSAGAAWLVHRGVSQQKKISAPTDVRALWGKKSKACPGLEISSPLWGRVTVKITAVGLRAMRDRSLVIVTDPKRPRVWTPKRIADQGELTRLA